MADEDGGGDALDERGRAPRREYVRGSLSTLQLPPRLAAAAAAVEPARFDALVEAIRAQWAASSPEDNGRTEATLKWTSLVNMCVRKGVKRLPLCARARACACGGSLAAWRCARSAPVRLRALRCVARAAAEKWARKLTTAAPRVRLCARSHLKAKGAYRTATLELLATTLLDIVFAAQGHAFVQARVCFAARVTFWVFRALGLRRAQPGGTAAA
jgi:hypothetical protein